MIAMRLWNVLACDHVSSASNRVSQCLLPCYESGIGVSEDLQEYRRPATLFDFIGGMPRNVGDTGSGLLFNGQPLPSLVRDPAR